MRVSRDRGRAGKRALALEPKRTGSKFQLCDSAIYGTSPGLSFLTSKRKKILFFFNV